ncbi:hypothetical protein THAOC_25403 [Thalassiosira oceanica]|uniref:Uncharacterized protein n=1 Tax=Thalassiosira oceanica TaxID=159749 RepID=K0RRB4_THAOC|nr:hypothetical protein THAOC_25403 [Thalassiosira oceanica]|eukprot:EJK54924.1 hypothetical protein THAOC_25403 [Thalassiosira oceanica]
MSARPDNSSEDTSTDETPKRGRGESFQPLDTAEGSARLRLPIYVVALSRRRRRSNDQLTLADTSRRRLSTAQKPAPTAHPSCRLRQTTPWQWCLKRRTYEQLFGARGAESRMDLAPVDRNEAADTRLSGAREGRGAGSQMCLSTSKKRTKAETVDETRKEWIKAEQLVQDRMEAETLMKKEMLNQELIESERLEGECIGAEKQARTKYSWLDSAPDTRLRSACCCFFALWLIDTVTPGPGVPLRQ